MFVSPKLVPVLVAVCPSCPAGLQRHQGEGGGGRALRQKGLGRMEEVVEG